MPASRAASITALLRSSSARAPKLLQPSPTADTCIPPIVRISMSSTLGGEHSPSQVGGGSGKGVERQDGVDELHLEQQGLAVGASDQIDTTEDRLHARELCHHRHRVLSD